MFKLKRSLLIGFSGFLVATTVACNTDSVAKVLSNVSVQIDNEYKVTSDNSYSKISPAVNKVKITFKTCEIEESELKDNLALSCEYSNGSNHEEIPFIISSYEPAHKNNKVIIELSPKKGIIEHRKHCKAVIKANTACKDGTKKLEDEITSPSFKIAEKYVPEIDKNGKDSQTQITYDTNLPDEAKNKTYDEAKKYCEDNDKRLPKANELRFFNKNGVVTPGELKHFKGFAWNKNTPNGIWTDTNTSTTKILVFTKDYNETTSSATQRHDVVCVKDGKNSEKEVVLDKSYGRSYKDSNNNTVYVDSLTGKRFYVTSKMSSSDAQDKCKEVFGNNVGYPATFNDLPAILSTDKDQFIKEGFSAMVDGKSQIATAGQSTGGKIYALDKNAKHIKPIDDDSSLKYYLCVKK